MFVIQQRTELTSHAGVVMYDAPLQYGDARAHEWRVDVVSRGNTVDLRDYTIAMYARRADGATVGPVAGEGQNGRASVVLTAECYAATGDLTLILRALRQTSAGQETATLAMLHAHVQRDTTDSVVDQENIIPDITQLLLQIEAMEQGTAAANTAAGTAAAAAEAANTAASAANTAATAANTAAGTANTAAGAADTATGAANTAAARAESIYDQVKDQIVPQFTIGTIATVPSSQGASATITGTNLHPVLNLTLPRGVDGDGHVMTVAGVEDDGTGNVPLSIRGVLPNQSTGDWNLEPADIGAVPETRKVNGHALTADVTLTPSDVGAMAADAPVMHSVTDFRATLPARDGWTPEKINNQIYSYRAEVSVFGILATDRAHVYLDTASIAINQMSGYQHEYRYITAVELRNGSVIVHADAALGGTAGRQVPILIEVIR